MSTDTRFFIIESIRHARTLPYTECLKYLRGLIVACGDLDEIADARALVRVMDQNDAQLELLATGQMRFYLDSDSYKPRPPRGKKGK